MLKKFCFSIIKIIVYFIKRLKLEIYIFDKIIFCIGDVQISYNKNLYDRISDLNDTEVKIFSQNGEDGILNYLINKLHLQNKNFVEIGVGNYRESNTRYLYQKYYPKGLIVDCLKELELKVKPHVNLWKGDLRICNEQINSNNIQNILNKYCDYEIDIFSLDIDSIDYWIIKKLNNNISKIFVAEYNSIFGHEIEVTVPDISGFDRSKYHYSNLCYGMSLKALIRLMEKKGFYFIGTNLQKNNAFFISNVFEKNKFFKNIQIKQLEFYTNSNIRESRDKRFKLNYLSGEKKINEIRDCEVIDLKNDKNQLIKLKYLI